MKRIAVAVEDNKGKNSKVSMHFGRCPYYLFVTIDGSGERKYEIIENPFYTNHQPGVVPQFIYKSGANVIIAGGMGPRAVDMFTRFGIEVVTGFIGDAEKIVDAYLSGEISGYSPCEHSNRECEH